MTPRTKLRPEIPERILSMSEEEQLERINDEKRRLGGKVVILGHHYQREAIIGVSDIRGDSFALSAKAAQHKNARYIVFCGVHFMAESARILAEPHQSVFLPDMTAGCPMADMAELDDVEICWRMLEESLGAGAVVPITYMNSSAEIKAFCGAHGGAVCTSSNASNVFRWALGSGKKILFLPDEHLGRNTANGLGISRSAQVVWDRKEELGGTTPDALRRADVILWRGFCHVHTHFTVEQVERMRRRFPGAKIVVHPECKEEVVALSDATGSTQYIVDYVNSSPPGAVVVIGTEVNLVVRLAHENPDKTVVPLSRSLCHNMFRINPAALLYTLEHLDMESDPPNEVSVDPEVVHLARKALEKMLELA